MPLVFIIQNGAYMNTIRINNQIIRGIIAGIAAAPLYIFLEIKKYESRLNLLPKMNVFILWMTLRL